MSFDLWLLVIGVLLVVMALAHPVVERLPITPTLIYLVAGITLGPWGLNAIALDPFSRHTDWLLHGSEIAVVMSLFTVGMKLRIPWNDPQLRPALCLATVSMILTVALVAGAGAWIIGLPIGAAVLLGGILGPTDPVLASEVQVQHPKDRDKIRLTLSAEAGLNDGTAFPFVMLGLGLLHLHDLGAGGWRWWVIDVGWAITGGIAVGVATGYGLGKLLVFFQTGRDRSVPFGEYLVLGLIGISYSLSVLIHAYGFLAVFSAGVALRAVEMKTSSLAKSGEKSPATKSASAYFAGVLLATNEQLEHLLAVAVVLFAGALLAPVGLAPAALWLVPLLFLVIRPLSAWPVRLVAPFSRLEFSTVSWFGIRGIGSVYYLMYAISGGLPDDISRPLASLTLTIVAVSIVIHGVSVTPLFNWYLAKRPSRSR